MQAQDTHDLLAHQLEAVRDLADDFGWSVEADLDAPAIEVEMQSPLDGEEYIVHLECSEFDQEPPYVEMVHPDTGELGGAEAYFDDRAGGGPSLIAFSDGRQDPILCHQFNRRVYVEETAPHNWDMANWKQDAGNLTTLGDILMDIYRRISSEEHYDGRYQTNG